MIQFPEFSLSSTLSVFIFIKSEAKFSGKQGRPIVWPKSLFLKKSCWKTKKTLKENNLCYNATYVGKWVKPLLRNFGMTPFKWQKRTFKLQLVITFISMTSSVTCRPVLAWLIYPFYSPTLGILSSQHLLNLKLS